MAEHKRQRRTNNAYQRFFVLAIFILALVVFVLFKSKVFSSAIPGSDNLSKSAGLPQEIKLSAAKLELRLGGTETLLVTIKPAESSNKSVNWSSSDERVAKVNDKGNITAVGVGSCVVKATAQANEKVFAEAAVTVSKAESAVKTEPPGGTNTAPTVSNPTYIKGILVVNKSYMLPQNYAPGLDSAAQIAFKNMRDAAAKGGLNIYISSGYRSFEEQSIIYQKYVKANGQAVADTFSARPGYSEHQTGLAIDLNNIDDSFGETPEAAWVAKHAHEYGFIVRYPKGKESITGFQYEPWHLRYLGAETAKKVYDSKLTLEEYLQIDSKYAS